MATHRHRFRIVAALYIVALPGCHLARPVRVSDINQWQLRNQAIAIEGKVTFRVSLIGVGVFVVNDGTGSIGVVTVNSPPPIARFVRVYGTVQNVFSAGASGRFDAELSVVIEEGTKESIVTEIVVTVIKSALGAAVH